MKTVTINQLGDYEGQDVQLKGWVYNTRSIGKIWFLIFRDGTGLLQGVVVKGEATDESFELEQCRGFVLMTSFMDDIIFQSGNSSVVLVKSDSKSSE